MMLRLVLTFCFAFCFVGGYFSAWSARAELQVDITQGNLAPLPIALPTFSGNDAESQRIGNQIVEVLSNDLARSGLFKPLDPAAFIQSDVSSDTPPRFPDWRVINAQALVAGKVDLKEDGQLQVAYRLWDVFGGTQLVGQRFNTVPGNWRRIAHIIADAVYKRITGEEGYFDSRIVYVAESGPTLKRVKRLAIMDQDGANHAFLTNGDYLVLTPRFSPSREDQIITYMSYKGNKPRVYLYNIDTGRQELLGDFPGMTFAPRFSPDGNKVIMSMANAGNSDVFVMDLRTRRMQRLTRHPAIDTSPCYSPDGSRVVFNSDRGGTQQLYVMNADGSNVTRISFGDGRYGTPVWSPRGDLVAFTKIQGGRFFIGVMRPDGSGERLLSESFLDEGPTWSPNGRVLMFFRQENRKDGRTRLWSVDLTGYNLREVTTPGDASDPAWSPLEQ